MKRDKEENVEAYPGRCRASKKIGRRERGLGRVLPISHSCNLVEAERKPGGEALLQSRVFFSSVIVDLVVRISAWGVVFLALSWKCM